jgi:peptidoglycan/LPS O-acetylase OafA/YrhL
MSSEEGTPLFTGLKRPADIVGRVTATHPVLRPGTRTRLDSLTGVRFAAALVVFLYHAGYYVPGGQLAVFGAGMTGVSLFYILSGFVMAWVLSADDRAILFYRRRFARIYPAYFIAVSAAITVSLVMRDFQATELSAYTLLQAWSPDPAVHYAASPVFWSLSCEAFFYAVFPFIAPRLARLNSRLLWAIAGSAVIAVMAIGAVASMFWDHEVVRWLAYIFPPTRLIEFVLGITLGLIVRRGFRLPIPVWLASIIAIASVLAASFAPGGLKVAAVTVAPFAALVVALAGRDADGGSSIFSSRALIELGVWSYCFYLVHAMLQGWTVRAGEFVGIPVAATLIIALGVSIVGAWLLHMAVERPAEKWLRPPRSGPRLDTD